MRKEILIVGTGGQGVKVLGEIIAKALALNKNLWPFCYTLYTPASRGGLVISNVVITDKRFDYPYVEEADFALLLQGKEANEFPLSGPFKNKTTRETKIIRVPGTENSSSVNFIGLGMLKKYLPEITDENIIKIMEKEFNQENFERNKRAFFNGQELNKE